MALLPTMGCRMWALLAINRSQKKLSQHRWGEGKSRCRRHQRHRLNCLYRLRNNPDEVSRPQLKHPVSGHINTYNPAPMKSTNFRCAPPSRSTRQSCQGSVSGRIGHRKLHALLGLVEQADHCGAEIEVVNDYKASRASEMSKAAVTLSASSKGYRGATASASGLCFCVSHEAVAHMLGRPAAPPPTVWLWFVEIHGDPANGVTERDMATLFRFLRTARCHIDAGAIMRNHHLNKSVKIVQHLGIYAQGSFRRGGTLSTWRAAA
ncbi:hypothetical protein PR001_g9744 [Phytophthora rubi]|uniref:Uncharacterized protein n=1 Tax=Phytophthora rubi TaxID=129364 RepID=A0A6A3MYW7_9STRA|nr:hypothetical protein PR001_g9744 [Phytophthora rubi]